MIKYLVFFLALMPFLSSAQEDSPLTYMENINKAYKPVLTRQFDFARALAQGQSRDFVEKQRKVLLNEIRDSRIDIKNMPRYKGNAGLRDSTVAFLDVTFNLVSEDYARIVQLEPLAENGPEEMESFLMAQQVAYSRSSAAARGLKQAEEEFADQFGVRLVDSDDKFAKKLEELNRTFKYYNKIYLIFFKAYNQELSLFDAIETQKLDRMITEKRKLEVTANEGLSKLDKIGSYQGDKSLRTAARANLEFYRNESGVQLSQVIDYYEELETLRKLKAGLNEQGISREERLRRTRLYNDQVQKVNESTPDLNVMNEELNNERARYLAQWNRVSEGFLQKFIN